MEELSTFLVLLAFLGITLVLLLPVMVAAFVVWKEGAGFPKPKTFILLSSLIAYGVPGLVSVMLVPLELVKNVLAPQWSAVGHELPGTILAIIIEAGEYSAIAGGVVAAFIAPLWLRTKWRDFSIQPTK